MKKAPRRPPSFSRRNGSGVHFYEQRGFPTALTPNSSKWPTQIFPTINMPPGRCEPNGRGRDQVKDEANKPGLKCHPLTNSRRSQINKKKRQTRFRMPDDVRPSVDIDCGARRRTIGNNSLSLSIPTQTKDRGRCRPNSVTISTTVSSPTTTSSIL